MPKHSRSRSRDRDSPHKSKKSHKSHKDKKKHKKHSRGRRDDSPSPQPTSHRSGVHRNENEQYKSDRGGSSRFGNGGEAPRAGVEEKKRSRFSEGRKDCGLMCIAGTMIGSGQGNNQQQFDSRSLMPPPSQFTSTGKKRKFVWTDANEQDLLDQQMFEKRSTADDKSPALLFGSNPSLLTNLNPAILSALQDSSKIKKKIYLPKQTGINYIGLLIGPRGLYQKRLEEESGCKILIRGKGSQKEGSAPQPDDEDEQHVLIIGDSTESVRRAQNAIERVISADDTTRNKIREEQLVVAQQINNSIAPNSQMDDSMMTPYGPPSPYAYIIPVPNDCVGLIIGKGGDTIRQLQMESGAKIQVAKKEIPNSNLRNVFVEGPPDRYQRAKEMIEDIIKEHRRTADPQIHVGDVNPFPGPHSKMKVPDKFVGLIIGKNGENLRGIAQRSNTKIFVPQKNIDPGSDERCIEVDGDPQAMEIARQEIYALIQRYMSQSGSSIYDYNKNPYGSGIAVYNQTKLSVDGQTINGAVPDSLKPESGSYASSLLTDNPSIAYNVMQLTGWSQYDYPNLDEEGNPIVKPAQQQQQDASQPQGYEQAYYQQPQYSGQYPQYDQQQQYSEYWSQYYPNGGGAYYPPGDQANPGNEQPHVQNPESQAQPSSSNEDQTQAQNYDYNQQQQQQQQYDYAYYQQYYQQYYAGQPEGGDYNAYYQQYYGQQNPEGQQVQEGENNQEPAQ